MNKIEAFLINFTPSTQHTYKAYLNRYFKTINANPDTYLEEKRDHQADVQQFWQSMKGDPPKTIRTALAAVKSFLMEYDIEFKTKFWKTLSRRTKGNRAVTMDKVPTNYQLKQILQHGETKARALFLILSSSGMRINEALQLTPKDIDMEHTPVKINIRGETTKTGNPRITFISKEAKDALQAWLKERDWYLERAIQKTNFKNATKTKTTRIFPFRYDNARVMWNRLTKKAGYDEIDERTKRHKMRIHTLRKYFSTRMSLEIPKDVVEALMGHEEYLTHVYRQYTDEQLAEMYLKAEEKITVFETPIDHTGLEKQIQYLNQENQQLRKDLDKIMDMFIRTNPPNWEGGTFGTSFWRKYEDGTQQMLVFDKEKRDFIPVGRRIPAPKTPEEEMELQYLEEQRYLRQKKQKEKNRNND